MFYYTTTGWMMWNWLVSVLGVGATVVLFDGNPLYPSPSVLWEFAQNVGITVFGTSARYLAAVMDDGCKPGTEFDLSKLRLIASTGSPASTNIFKVCRVVSSRVECPNHHCCCCRMLTVSTCNRVDFTYSLYTNRSRATCSSPPSAAARTSTAVSRSGAQTYQVCLALTPVFGHCKWWLAHSRFLQPTPSVYDGELQVRGLGLDVHIYNDDGKEVFQEQGELVCAKPFPSMPLHFWNDSDGAKYFNACTSR